jgi:hypothetical protein
MNHRAANPLIAHLARSKLNYFPTKTQSLIELNKGFFSVDSQAHANLA